MWGKEDNFIVCYIGYSKCEFYMFKVKWGPNMLRTDFIIFKQWDFDAYTICINWFSTLFTEIGLLSLDLYQGQAEQ